jgi:uncharacterized protein YjbI with pentapeptide repeats
MYIWIIVLTAIVIIAVLVMAKILQRTSEQLLVQLRARDNAQEARYQEWKAQQEKRQQEWREQQEQRLDQVEQRLVTQLQTILEEVHTKEVQDNERIDDLRRQYEAALSQAHMEHALAQLPRIEDTPLPGGSFDALPEQADKKSQPLSLPGVDLADRDLSHRYLRHANLQNAHFTGANLFMADLSGANLVGADLSHTNLSAANLTHADLRDANLAGANFLVADLNDANLSGANLRNARNLTKEQLKTAIVDSDVLLDSSDGTSVPTLAASNHH